MKILSFALIGLGLFACTTKSGGSSQSDAAEVVTDSVEETACMPVDTFSYKGYDMIAEILAGKAPDDAAFLTEVTRKPGFSAHTKDMTRMWQGYEANKIEKMRNWAKENLPAGIDTVFYPFGGPDFNHLSSFFPDVRYSVLIGIEPPGKMPFTDANSIAESDAMLKKLRESISYSIRTSFFVTKDMAEDLNSTLKGTLPVVLMFMSLHGYEIVNVNPVELTTEGRIEYTDPSRIWAHTLDKKFDKGFEVLYRMPGEEGVRTLVYLKTDLSNPGFDKYNTGNMVAGKFDGATTFLKAASYLMYDRSFSKIRDAILENSDMIVTGPSGIAYKDFDKDKWDMTLYGFWSPPIQSFKYYPQEDLKEAYTHVQAKPLDFRYDYGKGKTIYVAKKK